MLVRAFGVVVAKFFACAWGDEDATSGVGPAWLRWRLSGGFGGLGLFLSGHLRGSDAGIGLEFAGLIYQSLRYSA